MSYPKEYTEIESCGRCGQEAQVLEPRSHYRFICCVTKILKNSDTAVGAESRFMVNGMGSFLKTKECPSSERLLAFQSGEVVELDHIERHLQLCEFCSAEVYFYEKFPPVEEQFVAAGRIPEPLRQLADALLRGRLDLSPLYKLLTD